MLPISKKEHQWHIWGSGLSPSTYYHILVDTYINLVSGVGILQHLTIGHAHTCTHTRARSHTHTVSTKYRLLMGWTLSQHALVLTPNYLAPISLPCILWSQAHDIPMTEKDSPDRENLLKEDTHSARLTCNAIPQYLKNAHPRLYKKKQTSKTSG